METNNGAQARFAEVLDHLLSRASRRNVSAVSRVTGIPRAYFSEVRRGGITNPGVDKVVALARYFDVDEGDLVRAITDPHAPLPDSRSTVNSNRRHREAPLTDDEIARLRALLNCFNGCQR